MLILLLLILLPLFGFSNIISRVRSLVYQRVSSNMLASELVVVVVVVIVVVVVVVAAAAAAAAASFCQPCKIFLRGEVLT